MNEKKSLYDLVVASSVGAVICVKENSDDHDIDLLAELRLVLKNDYRIVSDDELDPFLYCEVLKEDLDALALDWLFSRYGTW